MPYIRGQKSDLRRAAGYSRAGTAGGINGSFGVNVRDLRGCVAFGKTRRRAMKLVRDNVELHIESLRECGGPIPAPASKCEIVKLPAVKLGAAAGSRS